MALPQINDDKPIYELKLPTTGKRYKYRPFLVREQKNILIANESGSQRESMIAMLNCIQYCVEDLNIRDLSTAEVDYIFMYVRSKSVGETIDITHKCDHCGHENKLQIKLSDIEILNYNKDVNIQLTDDISLSMKYPTYYDSINAMPDDEKPKVTELLFATLKNSLGYLQTGESNIKFSDESEEEIENFINSLNNEQLQKCFEHVESLPSLYYTQDYSCSKCSKENKLELKGFQDFLE